MAASIVRKPVHHWTIEFWLQGVRLAAHPDIRSTICKTPWPQYLAEHRYERKQGRRECGYFHYCQD